jgi:hypothetical protein
MANLMNKVLDTITDKIERLRVLDPAAEKIAAWTAPLYPNRAAVNLAPRWATRCTRCWSRSRSAPTRRPFCSTA